MVRHRAGSNVDQAATKNRAPVDTYVPVGHDPRRSLTRDSTVVPRGDSYLHSETGTYPSAYHSQTGTTAARRPYDVEGTLIE